MGIMAMSKPVPLPDNADKQIPFQYHSVMKNPTKPTEPIYTIGGIRDPKRSEPLNLYPQDGIEPHHFATQHPPSKPMMLANKLGKSRTRF